MIDSNFVKENNGRLIWHPMASAKNTINNSRFGTKRTAGLSETDAAREVQG
jgi:hypothetical protein